MPLYTLSGKAPSLPADGSAWVAPSADLIGDVVLGEGASVWFQAVARADNTTIAIGRNSNIQEGAMLHSDPGVPLTIGEGVTVGHHAILHGCTIGDNVLIGMGATVMNNAVIPDNCLIGAGALIPEGKTYPPGSLIMGAPAVAKRELTPEQIAGLSKSAEGYVAKSRLFAEQLRPV